MSCTCSCHREEYTCEQCCTGPGENTREVATMKFFGEALSAGAAKGGRAKKAKEMAK